MSTITTFTDKSQSVELPSTYVQKNEAVINFSETACLSGDVVQCLDIPANSVVFKVGAKVLTAEAGTHTLGDGADVDGYLTALDSSSTGVSLAGGALAGGKYYSVADTIDLVLGADMDSGKVSVFALYGQLEA